MGLFGAHAVTLRRFWAGSGRSGPVQDRSGRSGPVPRRSGPVQGDSRPVQGVLGRSGGLDRLGLVQTGSGRLNRVEPLSQLSPESVT